MRTPQAKKRALLYELNAVKNEEVDAEGNQILELEIQRRDYERLFGKREQYCKLW